MNVISHVNIFFCWQINKRGEMFPFTKKDKNFPIYFEILKISRFFFYFFFVFKTKVKLKFGNIITVVKIIISDKVV